VTPWCFAVARFTHTDGLPAAGGQREMKAAVDVLI